MKNRTDYRKNIQKELEAQGTVGAILEEYFTELGNQVTGQEIIRDKQLQYKGVDRIINLIDNGYSKSFYVDDKVQSCVKLRDKTAKYNHIFLPYYRRYADKSSDYDWATSEKKITDIVVILTGDNISILIDSKKLKESFHSNYEYLISKYGYDKENKKFYTTYNKLEKNGEFNSYEYTAYYIKPTLEDLMEDSILSECILAIYDIADMVA